MPFRGGKVEVDEVFKFGSHPRTREDSARLPMVYKTRQSQLLDQEVREFLKQRVERLKTLKKLDESLKDSKITLSDVDEISAKIKKGLAEKYDK